MRRRRPIRGAARAAAAAPSVALPPPPVRAAAASRRCRCRPMPVRMILAAARSGAAAGPRSTFRTPCRSAAAVPGDPGPAVPRVAGRRLAARRQRRPRAELTTRSERKRRYNMTRLLLNSSGVPIPPSRISGSGSLTPHWLHRNRRRMASLMPTRGVDSAEAPDEFRNDATPPGAADGAIGPRLSGLASEPTGSGAPTVDGTPGMPPSPNSSGPSPAARLRAISASAARARGARACRRSPAAQRDEQRLGGVAHVGRDVVDRDVAQDGTASLSPILLERGDQVQPAGAAPPCASRSRSAGSRRACRRPAAPSPAAPAHRCGGRGC